MRKLLPLLLLGMCSLFAINVMAQDDDVPPICEFVNPVDPFSLPWFADFISDSFWCDCGYTVEQFCYNGDPIFLFNAGGTCLDVDDLFYDLGGNQLCLLGNFVDGGAGCPTSFDYTQDQLEALPLDLCEIGGPHCGISEIWDWPWINEYAGNDCYSSIHAFTLNGQDVYYVSATPECMAFYEESLLITCDGIILCADSPDFEACAEQGYEVWPFITPEYLVWENILPPNNCELLDPIDISPSIWSIIESPQALACECNQYLEQRCYNGESVFFFGAAQPNNCADYPTSVYDIDGNLLCTLGGIAGNTCPELPWIEESEQVGILWTCEAQQPCPGVEPVDPLSLPWFEEAFSDPLFCECDYELEQYCYNNEVILIASPQGTCLDVVSIGYTVSGLQLCIFNGFEILPEGDICPFYDEYTEVPLNADPFDFCTYGYHCGIEDIWELPWIWDYTESSCYNAIYAFNLNGQDVYYAQASPECMAVDGVSDLLTCNGTVICSEEGDVALEDLCSYLGYEIWPFITPEYLIWEQEVGCICADVYAPVCGVDGQTYGNECEAACEGIMVLYEGVCEPNVEIAHISICNTQQYDLFVPELGDEEGASLVQGATNADDDLFAYGPSKNGFHYRYVPFIGFEGTEVIQINLTDFGGFGPTPSVIETYIVITVQDCFVPSCLTGDDPSDYPWLQDLIENADGCAVAQINQFQYNGDTYFVTYPGDAPIGDGFPPCPTDIPVFYYTCDGTQVCSQGFTPFPTCDPDLTAAAANGSLYWSFEGNNGPHCEVEDIWELPWIQGYVDNSCYNAIYAFELNGQDVFYIQASPECLATDVASILTDCEGNLICVEGFAPLELQCSYLGYEVWPFITPEYLVWQGPVSCDCIAVYDPVCGVDGQTYGNACEAACEGVAIAYPGECEPNICNVVDPLTLPWLQDLISSSFYCECGYQVQQYCYEGEQIFVIEPLGSCLDVPILVYDLGGNILCTIGGLIGEICPLFGEYVANPPVAVYSTCTSNNCEPFTFSDAENYPWMWDLIESSSCECNETLIHYCYEGESVFLFGPEQPSICSDYITTVYDINGNVICLLGGIVGNTCPELPNLTESPFLGEIWSCPNCSCPEIYAPVCGVNGQTYDNECFAACEGVEVAYDGFCNNNIACDFSWELTGSIATADEPTSSAVNMYCFTDNIFTDNICSWWWDFGNGQTSDVADPCDISFDAIVGGVPVNQPYEVCLSVVECGSDAVHVCCQELFVNGPDPCVCPDVFDPVCGVDGQTYGNECEAVCAGVAVAYTGFCIDPCICPDVYAPVCGVDGFTYSNECEANCAGVPIAYDGECELGGLFCGVEDVWELPWLQFYIEDCFYDAIYSFVINGQEVVYVQVNPVCDLGNGEIIIIEDLSSTLFDCSGNVICSDGGFTFPEAQCNFQGYEVWPFITPENLIWSASTNPGIAGVGMIVTTNVYLQGAFVNSPDELMRDDLRAKGLIPLTEPYTDLPGFEQVNGGGGEQTTNAVLQVTGADAIVDWLLVELRDPSNNVMATRSALLQRDGDVVDVDGVSPVTFNVVEDAYNVCIRHRNHLGVITDVFGTDNASLDFSADAAFGSNSMADMPFGKKAMWGGSPDANGAVTFQGPNSGANKIFFDVVTAEGNEEDLPNYTYADVYIESDLDMNGEVIYQGDGSEVNFLFFTVLQHPENVSTLANYTIFEQVP